MIRSASDAPPDAAGPPGPLAAPDPRADRAGGADPIDRAPVLGMVGGGQLARMTHQAAIALGVDFRVLADRPDDSAARVVAATTVGDERSAADVAGFAAGCDVLTFDHEHVPGRVLEDLERAGVFVRPGSAALRHAQDKAVMRRRLDEIGVASPRHALVDGPADVVEFAAAGDRSRPSGRSRQSAPAWPVVLKTARGGYDGKGVWTVTGPDDPTIGEPFRAGVPVLAEEHVRFEHELAVLVARSPSGQAVAYPVVESVQRDGICVEVIAPAPSLPAPLVAEAQRTGLRVAEALGVVGLLAVEMFRADDGRADQLLVNELAMRPHNTGHWTIDGAVTSQFENHVRAVLDLPLGAPQARAAWSVMVNVLGGSTQQAADLHGGLLHCLARDPALKVHLYGKEVRPGRKLGHVTVYGDDLADLRRRAWYAADHLGGQSTGPSTGQPSGQPSGQRP